VIKPKRISETEKYPADACNLNSVIRVVRDVIEPNTGYRSIDLCRLYVDRFRMLTLTDN